MRKRQRQRTDAKKAAMAAEFFGSSPAQPLSDQEMAAEAAMFLASPAGYALTFAERAAMAATFLAFPELTTLSGRLLLPGYGIEEALRISLCDAQQRVIRQAETLADVPTDNKRSKAMGVIHAAIAIKSAVEDVDTLFVQPMPHGDGKVGEPRTPALDDQAIARRTGLIAADALPDCKQRVQTLLALALLAIDLAARMAQDMAHLGDPARGLSVATFMLHRANQCASDAEVHASSDAAVDASLSVVRANDVKRKRAQTKTATATAKARRKEESDERQRWVQQFLTPNRKGWSAERVANHAVLKLDDEETTTPAKVRDYFMALSYPDRAIAAIVSRLRRPARS